MNDERQLFFSVERTTRGCSPFQKASSKTAHSDSESV